MNTHSDSHHVQQNWKKLAFTGIMLLSVPLMIIPIIKGFSTGFQYIMLLGGIILFFFSLLNFLHKSPYYVILGVIFLLLLIFEFVGDDIFKNMNLKSHLGEDIAFSVGFFLLAGIIASIIGIARWR